MSKSDHAAPGGIEKDEENLFAKGFALALTLTLLVLLFGAVVAQLAPHIPPSIKAIKKLGEVGDFVGGMLNPVISGCTLVVAFAVWRLQKTELTETQRELQIQRGQQRFFDLLNVYHRTVDSISSSYVRPVNRLAKDPMKSMQEVGSMYEQVGSEHITLIGKAALARERENLEAGEPHEYFDDEYPTINWKSTVAKAAALGSTGSAEALAKLQQEWIFAQSSLVLSHYFRTFRLLLNEAESLLGSEEHRRYVAIFIAQLSDDELMLIGYYLWLDPHGNELLPMAKQYGLLQSISDHGRNIFTAVLPLEVFAA
ncbi:hypothetical protein EXV95_11250 [Acidovorax sp. JMULE5]|uniref:putative phage abortive infection protein n=1 Tax=Acidovorax sp. JMULE5 TaxID=2518343 RepID=UPI0015A14114|nr:putative phage abortive infection protein [Acidovorax sp. JMULE5]QLA81160.1 hypothetical protein EXV95_11250 [Acidovorax sp. JMULE5]